MPEWFLARFNHVDELDQGHAHADDARRIELSTASTPATRLRPGVAAGYRHRLEDIRRLPSRARDRDAVKPPYPSTESKTSRARQIAKQRWPVESPEH